MVEKNQRLVLSISEAGELLGVSRPTAYQMAHDGQIPIIKLGKRRMVVPKSALEKMLLEAGTKPEAR
jgi:excisionase family DNA binding protein